MSDIGKLLVFKQKAMKKPLRPVQEQLQAQEIVIVRHDRATQHHAKKTIMDRTLGNHLQSKVFVKKT